MNSIPSMYVLSGQYLAALNAVLQSKQADCLQITTISAIGRKE